MAGKPYSIREMKTIVDYLVEHKAYGEIKGRRMWMDFASTRLTDRTWQSLKETFLKRILPDITNPYYRLDINQINSFKRGLNLTETDKKLEFEPVGDKSNNNDAKGDEQPSTSKNEENATGEDTTHSKVVHNRASTETLVLENCYETAEEIQRDLEGSSDDQQDDEQNDAKQNANKPALKSLRDFIEYTEPLTPMLQEVLDDFASDEESDRMLIDESYVAPERKSNSPDNAVLSQSILKPQVATENAKTSANEADNEDKTNHESNKEVAENNEQPANTIDKQVPQNHEESVTLSQFEDVMNLVDKALAKNLGSQLDTLKESQGKVQNSHEASSNITDTLLPNNQEAVNSKTFPNLSPPLPTPQVNNEDQSSKKRKRSSSTEIIETNKTKKQKDIDQSIANSKCSESVETMQTNVEQLIRNLNKDFNIINDPEPVHSGNDKHKNEPQKKKKHNLTINSGKTPQEQNKPVPNDIHINSDSSEVKEIKSSGVENPCLKSVSLFAEQISSTKLSDSDINMIDDGKKITTKNPEPKSNSVTPVVENVDDVILLKSHSNSESDGLLTHVSPRMARKQQREKIANVFGFTNGGSAQSRKMNGRKRTISHRSQKYASSESSEWTSASDSEYVTPPRGRRYRYHKNRKYVKPPSGRVISLENGRGMYVMLGKKIYPLTKQGKHVQNFVTHTSDSDPELDDNYWKNKYVEERKRTAELKKIMYKSKQDDVPIVSEPKSPIQESPVPPPQQEQSVAREIVHDDDLVKRKETVVNPETPCNDKTLKIKFTKKDQEIQLEGHWQNINPVLAQVVSMFNKEPSAALKLQSYSVAVNKPESINCVELSSGTTTPTPAIPSTADTVIIQKVNEIESEIFQEIVEKHEADVQPTATEDNKNASKATTESDTNVTVRKRRGRPKKSVSPAITISSSITTEQAPAVEAKLNNVDEEKEQGIIETPAAVTIERRTTRTPRKFLEAATNAKNASTRQSKSKISTPKATEDEDEEILYKFPSPPPAKRGRKSTSVTNNAIETATNHTKPQITSPEGLSNNSINSNQGYQDSDASPFNIGLRKKRRFSVCTMSLRGRKSYRKSRSKSHPNLIDYETSESSNSSFTISVKSATQSSVSSEVHRSESYQLLMPRTKKIMQALDKIEETSNEHNLGNVTNRRTSNVRIEISEDQHRTANNEVASSSCLSFPPSPEISIVENISVSKSTITGNEDHPTINEMQSQLTAMNPNNKFIMSEIDVSMPLMAQECSLQKHFINVLNEFSELKNAGRFLSTPDLSAPKIPMTESVLNEMKSVNAEGSLSDSLDRRLEQLLLESAQKSTTTQNQQTMEVDTAVKKNPRSRKRSSTPNKKKTVQRKTKIPEVSVVEEECKARCGHSGRRSCPPSINIVYREGDVPDNLKINIHEHTTLDAFPVTKHKKAKKAKKDIIKVKIMRPIKKPEAKKSKTRPSVAECDNESGVFLQGFEDVSDLIHNHSELCLFNTDCIQDKRRDSVEFIEMTSHSIITLNSSASPEGSKDNINVNIIIKDRSVTPELFNDNAQCAADLDEANAIELASPESGNTQYFTPVSPNSSVITEDLSDETPAVLARPRPTKWYLLSEEDTNTTNSNYFDSCQDETNDFRSFGANLQQIFPITCAVPDLSTITEMSEKNSPKLGLEKKGDTDFDSQSMN